MYEQLINIKGSVWISMGGIGLLTVAFLVLLSLIFGMLSDWTDDRHQFSFKLPLLEFIGDRWGDTGFLLLFILPLAAPLVFGVALHNPAIIICAVLAIVVSFVIRMFKRLNKAFKKHADNINAHKGGE